MSVLSVVLLIIAMPIVLWLASWVFVFVFGTITVVAVGVLLLLEALYDAVRPCSKK